jgi:hypothetical protein
MTSCTGNWPRCTVSAMTANEAHDLRAAGAAALLELMDAAQAWAAKASGLGTIFDPEAARVVELAERLEILTAELKPEPSHVWVPSTWAEVATYGPGTRVRLGGVEALVESAVSTTWHVDPRSPSRAPRPLETTLVNVKLAGRDQTYQFPPGNSVEVQDVNWPTVHQHEWAAAALAAQEERALRLLKEAFGRVEKVDG